MARTLGQMIETLTDNLTGEGVDVPGVDRLVTLLNTAKNHVAVLRDKYDRHHFTVRKDYSVPLAAVSIDLPDGSGVDPAVHRLVGAEWVEEEARVRIYSQGDEGVKDNSAAGFHLLREGSKLYLSVAAGRAMTLRLRYIGLPADLDSADKTVGFANLGDAWSDLAVMRATLAAIPGAKETTRGKYLGQYNEQAKALREAAGDMLDGVVVRLHEDDGDYYA